MGRGRGGKESPNQSPALGGEGRDKGPWQDPFILEKAGGKVLGRL